MRETPHGRGSAHTVPTGENVDHYRTLDEIASAQCGLVTSAQAIALLGRKRKERWYAEGRLVQVQPRVSRVAGAPVTWHQRCLAAQLATDGLVSHRSAASVLGMTSTTIVEVAVRAPRQPRIWEPAVLHRCVDLNSSDGIVRDGLRLTDPVRTIIDLGLVMPEAAVDAALGVALASRLLRVEDVVRLRRALSRSGRTGVGIIDRVLEQRLLTAAADESVLETELRRLLARRGLPLPQFQLEVWHRGTFVARVDAGYPDLRLALEVDGYAGHGSPQAFQLDRTRQNRLVALGWTVLRFTWADVARDPEGVARTVSETHARLSRSLCA